MTDRQEIHARTLGDIEMSPYLFKLAIQAVNRESPLGTNAEWRCQGFSYDMLKPDTFIFHMTRKAKDDKNLKAYDFMCIFTGEVWKVYAKPYYSGSFLTSLEFMLNHNTEMENRRMALEEEEMIRHDKLTSGRFR